MEKVEDNVLPINKSPDLFPKKLRNNMEDNLKSHGENPKLIVTVVEQTICAFAIALVGMAATVVAEKLVERISRKFSKN